jgi:hypothetical protein
MSAGGKGHTQRPTDEQKFQENFDKIFGKKKDENSSSTQCPVAQDGASKETLPPA